MNYLLTTYRKHKALRTLAKHVERNLAAPATQEYARKRKAMLRHTRGAA